VPPRSPWQEPATTVARATMTNASSSGWCSATTRRHPERARAKLLDLLGEALTTSSAAPAAPPGG